MPQFLQVEAVSEGQRRRRGGSLLLPAVRAVVFLVAAWSIWTIVELGPVKSKFHGALLTALSCIFTLQEFLFFNIRGRLGEALKSAALPGDYAREMLARLRAMKAYLDATWIWALGSKIVGLAVGLLLMNALLSGKPALFHGLRISANTVAAIVGWFAVLNGAFLTLRTFRAFRHIDSVLANLETEAREISARKQTADALRSSKVEEASEDESLGGYARLPKSDGKRRNRPPP